MAPALDLPSIDLGNASGSSHRRESDPLRVPNLSLPQPNVSLPNYDRPEVNMKTGQLKNKAEFSIPTVQLPIIRDLHLPKTDTKLVSSPIDPMKVPHIQLPDLQYQSNPKVSSVDQKFNISTDEIVSDPSLVKPQPLSIEEKYSITDTRFVQTSEPLMIVEVLSRLTREFSQ